MTRLVDTTRPAAVAAPAGRDAVDRAVLEVAEILDAAGFEALEVTGGGCFEAAVKRGTESPWERVRALKRPLSTNAAPDGAARAVPGRLAARSRTT